MTLSFDIKDPNYSLKDSASYKLITYLSDSVLALLVFDIRANKYVMIRSFELPGIRILKKEVSFVDNITELNLNYQKRITIVSNPFTTVVPSEFFKPDTAPNYYKFNFELSDSKDIRYDFIRNLNSYLIYTLNLNQNLIDKVFKPDVIFHSATSYITAIYSNIENYLSNKFFIDIERSYLRIAVLQEGKLMLFNSFNYKSPEDILYHLLNISNNFDINPDKDKYLFSGHILKDSELYKLIFKHIRYPLLVPNINAFLYSRAFDIVPLHIFYSSFAAGLCE